MVVAGDKDREATALAPPADLPLHREARGDLGKEGFLEGDAIEGLLQEELSAQEEAPAARVGGVLVRVDDVRAALKQEARDGGNDAWAVCAGDQQARGVARRLGLYFFLVLVVEAGAGVVFLTSVPCSDPFAPILPT